MGQEVKGMVLTKLQALSGTVNGMGGEQWIVRLLEHARRVHRPTLMISTD